MVWLELRRPFLAICCSLGPDLEWIHMMCLPLKFYQQQKLNDYLSPHSRHAPPNHMREQPSLLSSPELQLGHQRFIRGETRTLYLSHPEPPFTGSRNIHLQHSCSWKAATPQLGQNATEEDQHSGVCPFQATLSQKPGAVSGGSLQTRSFMLNLVQILF